LLFIIPYPELGKKILIGDGTDQCGKEIAEYSTRNKSVKWWLYSIIHLGNNMSDYQTAVSDARLGILDRNDKKFSSSNTFRTEFLRRHSFSVRTPM
jgi:hypothetical protein